MANWIPLTQVAACPPGSSLECVAAERIVALFNVAGTFYALDGVCPHQGGPLGKGTLDLATCQVACPWHGWRFDVRTGGHSANPKLIQPSFPTRIEADIVYVDLPEEPAR